LQTPPGKGRRGRPEIDPVRRDLMLRFASLGTNCEFGVAQRAFGAEPMDLLRWATTPPQVLLRLLVADFDRIEHRLSVSPQNRNYDVRSERYQFGWHTWLRQTDYDLEEVLEIEQRRLPGMAAKLRKEIREASRIFVIKWDKPDLDVRLVRQIHAVMQRYGKPILMYVTRGEAVSVREERPRLLHGTLPRFAEPNLVPSTTPADDWLALCQAAARLVDERDGDGVAGADKQHDIRLGHSSGECNTDRG
jgi:hypothetical protein